MWKLINADSEYNYLSNCVSWAIILSLVILNSLLGGMEEVMAVIMILTALVFGGGEATESAKTKRIRMLSILPLSARMVGLYRQIGAVIAWTLYMALLAVSSLISQRGNLGPDYAWWILTRIGYMFIFIGFMDLAYILYFCVKEKKPDKTVMGWVVFPSLWIVAIAALLLYFFSNSPGDHDDGFLNSIAELALTLPGSLSILLFGLIIMALNVYAYERRRSFLEETIIS